MQHHVIAIALLIIALLLRCAIALSSSRHSIIASCNCSIASLSAHFRIIALRKQTSIVRWCNCELPGPMWNALLIASYQNLFCYCQNVFYISIFIFFQCLKIVIHFIFSSFVTIDVASKNYKVLFNFYLQQIARFLQCFWGLMVFPLFIKQIR